MLLDHQKEIEKDREDLRWVEDVTSITPSSSDNEADGVQLDDSETKKLEKRLLRKIDLNILPLMALSMFVSFLVCYDVHQSTPLWTCSNKGQDRGNIGNARVLGMQKDLGFSNQKFINIIMMFCKLKFRSGNCIFEDN